jgi:flagellar motor protein MotB
MAKSIFAIEVQGFASGQTDFFERISTIPVELLEPLAQLIDGIFEASSDPSSKKFIAIAIVGHADRQDIAGRTDEQRRESERQSAQARADSASNWLLNKLGDLQDPGGVIELDWRGVKNIGVATIANGAARLINPNPGSTENLRAQNRRVEFLVTSIDVDEIQGLDGRSILIG